MNGISKIIMASLLATLLASSSYYMAYAQELPDWRLSTYNSKGWSWSPQRELSLSNVKALIGDWIFTLPAPTAGGIAGVTHTLVAYKGIGYALTNIHRLFAIDLRNARVLWFLDLRQPANLNPAIEPELKARYYSLGIYTVDDSDFLVLGTSWQRVVLVDPLKGDIEMTIDLIPQGERVEGNLGSYGAYPINVIVDERRGILVAGATVPDGTTAGRGFIDGYDISGEEPTRLWRLFLMPPQDGSDLEWGLRVVEQAGNAWVFNGEEAIDLKAMPIEELAAMVGDDWGRLGASGSPAGVGAGWGGSWVVDEEKGVVYVTTSYPNPPWNATARPGPNLLSSSIIAINVETGDVRWFFQIIPHDVWGYGCNNGLVLGDGRLFAVCGNAFLLALDADTGRLLWSFSPREIERGAYSRPLNPLDPRDMVLRWQGDGYVEVGSVVRQSPAYATSMRLSYDPESSILFFTIPNLYEEVTIEPPSARSLVERPSEYDGHVYAIDANSGDVVWHKRLEGEGEVYPITTEDMLLAMTSKSSFLVFKQDNGEELYSREIQGASQAAPSIVYDIEGNLRVVTSISSTELPGHLFSLRLLRLEAQEGTVTVVVTETRTVVAGDGEVGDLARSVLGLLLVSLAILALAIVYARRKRRHD